MSTMLNGFHWYEQQICHQISQCMQDNGWFGEMKNIYGYLHFLKKCLESYDFNFDSN